MKIYKNFSTIESKPLFIQRLCIEINEHMKTYNIIKNNINEDMEVYVRYLKERIELDNRYLQELKGDNHV